MAILGLVMVVTAIWDLFLGISSSHCRHLTSLSQPACQPNATKNALESLWKSQSLHYTEFLVRQRAGRILFSSLKNLIYLFAKYILRIKNSQKRDKFCWQNSICTDLIIMYDLIIWYEWWYVYVSINETLPKQNSTKIHVLLFKVPIYRKKKNCPDIGLVMEKWVSGTQSTI